MEFVEKIAEKCGISKEQAEKVVAFLKDHSDEVLEYLGKNDTVKGMADKVGLGGLFDRAVRRCYDDQPVTACNFGDERGSRRKDRGRRRRRCGVGSAARDRGHRPALLEQAERDRRSGATGPDQGDGALSFFHGKVKATAVRRTPLPASSGGRTRSGATSRNGTSTKARSHMRGCGTTKSSVSMSRSE